MPRALGQMFVIYVATLAVLRRTPARWLFRGLVWPLLLLPVVAAVAISSAFVANLRELAALVRDERTRVIHGLEHATIAVLQESGVFVRNGSSGEPGFEIVINPLKGRHVTPAFLRRSVLIAIKRVRAGDTAITRTPACGTSRLVALVLFSLLVISAALLFALGNTSFIPAIVLAVIAELVVCGLGRQLGLLAQKYFTVSTRFRAAKVGPIDSARLANGAQILRVALKIKLANRKPKHAAP